MLLVQGGGDDDSCSGWDHTEITGPPSSVCAPEVIKNFSDSNWVVVQPAVHVCRIDDFGVLDQFNTCCKTRGVLLWVSPSKLEDLAGHLLLDPMDRGSGSGKRVFDLISHSDRDSFRRGAVGICDSYRVVEH